MIKESRNCQNCHQEFWVESEDFDFYKKINVPPPTFCWGCRLQRRMTFRNERTLYKRKCNAPGHGEDIISVYSPDKKLVIYDEKYWWSDAWDPLDYGTDYDFSRPFFQQYKGLLERIPLIGLSVTNMSNCRYCNVAEGDKDSYCISASWRNEHVLYSNRVTNNKDSLDLYISDKGELCYDCVSCRNCYRLLFSVNCNSCVDSAFIFDCVNCQNCFGCTNLRNKQYYLFNEPLTKEEYFKGIKSFDLGDYSNVQELFKKSDQIRLANIHKNANIIKCVDTTGDNCINAKNCHACFDISGDPSLEDGRYCVWAGYGLKDAYDSGPGAGELETSYEVFDTGISSSNVCFTGVVYGSYMIRYGINCHGSNNLFGCYGLRSKEYCILNKQYTKDEYAKLMPQIIKHMNTMPYIDTKSRIYKYGEFFPVEISPFSYNESIAYDYFNLSKAEALSYGFSWHDSEDKNYNITIKPDDLPQNIKDIPDSIVNEIIGCAHAGRCNHQCTTAFKVINDELNLYRQLGVAFPRLCPNCRHHERLTRRNPLKLWHRRCQCLGNAQTDADLTPTNAENVQRSSVSSPLQSAKYINTCTHFHGNDPCPNEFETSYAPERPEIIYCEQCYNAEVA